MLAAMIAACSSDDNSGEGHKIEEGVLKSLKLEVSATSVLVGEEVSFSLLDDTGKEIDGAIMLNGKEIAKKYVFNQAGAFKITGAKQGFNTSNEVTITVAEKERAPLTLKVSKAEVEIGEKVVFEVISQDVAVTDGVKIFDVKSNKALEGLEFIATEAGEFEFIAKGEAFVDSEKIVVKVKEAVKALETKLTINGKNLKIGYVNLDVKSVNPKGATSTPPAFVVDMGDGVYGNEYSIVVNVEPNENAGKRGFIFVDVWIANPTIKVDASGKVTDYGQRILPNKDSKLILKSVYSSIEGYSASDVGSRLSAFEMKFVKVNYESSPVRPNTYNGELEVMFKYISTTTPFDMNLEFNGESLFRERD